MKEIFLVLIALLSQTTRIQSQFTQVSVLQEEQEEGERWGKCVELIEFHFTGSCDLIKDVFITGYIDEHCTFRPVPLQCVAVSTRDGGCIVSVQDRDLQDITNAGENFYIAFPGWIASIHEDLIFTGCLIRNCDERVDCCLKRVELEACRNICDETECFVGGCRVTDGKSTVLQIGNFENGNSSEEHEICECYCGDSEFKANPCGDDPGNPPPGDDPANLTDCGIAFGKYEDRNYCFEDIYLPPYNPPIDQWGWTNKVRQSSYTDYTFTLYSGAEHCDTSIARIDGTAIVKVPENDRVIVDLYPNENVVFTEVHIYVGKDILPIKDWYYVVTPGYYTVVDEEPDNDNLHYEIDLHRGSSKLYVIIHAVSCIAL
eukprot:CAMPEP_0174261620 /NCGR_PEP_ID=MMETSP0439-20130205/11624_1 /TAXON_ID=0 /ORGANISM="Stereomyxa ramosa, Strain Chinc5" /LENGTH=372 /DNA_ID=CAMNT_0015346125 /DNA_START=22 /DNA_END=1140 /DNA_ORIENTATION=+